MRLARLRTLGAIVSVLAGLALAAGVYAIASGGRSDEPKAQDPCQGLSSAQCQTLIASSQKEFETRLSQWLAQFNSPDADLSSLPKVPLSADYPPPYPTLAEAAKAADAIVVGTAQGVSFEPQWQASVTISVQQVIKGAPPATLTLRQGGGPQPYLDWTSAVLAVADADPLLLPGDRALLFLKAGAVTGSYEAQPWTGHYRVSDGGKVSALPQNPFASDVEGLSLNALAAKVQAAVSQP